MEDPQPAFNFTCTVGTSQGCAADEVCVDEGAPRCTRMCSSQVACAAGEACTPTAPDSLVQICRPIDCDAGLGCGGADAGDDPPIFGTGSGGSPGFGGSFGTGGPIAGDAWPQYGHDAKHTGRSSAVPSHAPALLWQCDLPGSAGFADLVIDAQKNLYAWDDQQVYAIDPVGKLRWTAGAGVASAGVVGVAVASSGDLVWTEKGGNLHGARADGTGTFDLKLQGPSSVEISRPTLGLSGIVYVTTRDVASGIAALHAVDPAGVLLWSFNVSKDHHRPGQPAQDDDGSLAITLAPDLDAVGTSIVKLSSAGFKLWSRPLPALESLPGAATFGPGGSIRASENSRILGFSGAGDALFDAPFASTMASLTPIDDLGNTYSAHLGGVDAVDPAGSYLWKPPSPTDVEVPVGIYAAPALSADDVLVVRLAKGTSFLQGIYRGKTAWSHEGIKGTTTGVSVIIGPDATIYAASGAHVVALR